MNSAWEISPRNTCGRDFECVGTFVPQGILYRGRNYTPGDLSPCSLRDLTGSKSLRHQKPQGKEDRKEKETVGERETPGERETARERVHKAELYLGFSVQSVGYI